MIFVSEQIMKNVETAVQMMGKGMLGIFVVIALIAIIVYALTKIGEKSGK